MRLTPKIFLFSCLMYLASAGLTFAETPAAAVIDSDGVRITISLERLNSYLQRHPGMSPRDGLEQLIEFELLAVQATKAGVSEDDAVKTAMATAMVIQYLNDFFEPLWTEKTIPDELIRRSYKNNRRIFNHPELRQGVHVIVTHEGKFPDDPELAETALRIAKRVDQAYRDNPPASQAEFQRMAGPMVEWAGDSGLKVEYQSLSRFPRKGRYSMTFTDAVFAHAEEKVVLPMFKSEFGYHLVWVEKVIPARKVSFEDAREGILARIVPEVRSMKLLELTDTLSSKYPSINRGKGARRLMNPMPLLSMELDAPGQ